MTDPAGTVRLDAVVTAPTVREAAAIALDAAACVKLTTSGTVTSPDPDDTVNATALPGSTGRPVAGLEAITKPAGTLALDAVVTAPTERPAAMIAALAAVSVVLTMLGTATDVPDRTISTAAIFQRLTVGSMSDRATGVPALALAPADCTQNVSPAAVSTYWVTIV